MTREQIINMGEVMATRGRAAVAGVGRDGRWIITPDAAALDVLMQAHLNNELIELRRLPTRERFRRPKPAGGLVLHPADKE